MPCRLDVSLTRSLLHYQAETFLMYIALLAVLSAVLLAVVSIFNVRYVAIVAGIIGITLFFAAWMGLIL